jgi:glutathione synthase/RimK-type ligase-like ATP-grasp enzyme
MEKYDITLLTAEQYFNPINPDWYILQILQEDQIVRDALERKGLRVHRIDWTNKEFDWSSTRAVVFRAVWDYTLRYDEFLRFLHFVETKTVMINPLKTILWNLDKHYLQDLENSGIRIPQTIYIEKNETITLQQIHSQHRFSESILKPAMSAGARHTYRLDPNTLDRHEDIFQQLLAAESMMLQPFLHRVLTEGEITLIIIGGKYSHAVLKKAKSGDFRVQDDFGGTVHHYQPAAEEIAFAERAVAVCSPLPLYARVDLLRDNSNQLVISELELIEPELWFRFYPPAADLFADAITKMI